MSQHLQVLERLRSDDKEKQKQEKIANTIKQQGEKAKKEVKDKTKKIIEMMQENERELLRQIDEKLDTATTNLNIIHHIPAVEEYIKNVMERGLASEMMNFKEKQCSHFVFNPIVPNSRIDFLPNQELMRQVNSGLGEIQTCFKTDHTKSTVEVTSETEALKKEKLILITKTSTGELNHDPKNVIDIQINPTVNVEIQKTFVGIDGKIEVEFMAKVAGRLTAEVQVNGNHVSNSPLLISVKPQALKRRVPFNTKGLVQGVHVPWQEPLLPSVLAQETLQDQKQMLGECLFPLIQCTHPDLAGKITGMLLELDNTEIMHMLESPKALEDNVKEAIDVLKAYCRKQESLKW